MTLQPDEQMTQSEVQIQRLGRFQLLAVLFSLMLTLLLSALDQTIVGTALPRIIADLQGFDLYPWVLTAYLLASTTMVPIVGKLSDQFGRKWFLLASVLVFLVGSILAGSSQTMENLIFFRGLQGLGAGSAQTLCFTIVADLFPPTERARWTGIFTAIFGFASVIGPAAGGWITDHWGWRWAFYINLPLAAVAFVALLIWLPRMHLLQGTGERGWAAVRQIDLLGSLTVAGATICLLLGLSWGGQTFSWTSWQVIGTLSASCVLFIIFFLAERRAQEPILPLSLLRNQIFAASALLTLLIGMALLALTVYIPLFIQAVQGNCQETWCQI
ncbi:MAG TPA: MFS transporter [Ktedonobacteraceae bacterium]|nr:MFS transporter [Ktedonobacteraceae bacterium]